MNIVVKDPVDGYIDWLGEQGKPLLQEQARATVRRRRELEMWIQRALCGTDEEALGYALLVQDTIMSVQREWCVFMRCVIFYMERVMTPMTIVVPRDWIGREGASDAVRSLESIEELRGFYEKGPR
jgi:hypothetical protein